MMKPIPRITVSYAQSLDGRIATSTGDSRWISCPRTLTLAHKLRRDNEVILVGIGTVLRDDPELSCRLKRPCPSPVRVVLDSHLRLPTESTILRTCGTYRTIVYTTTGTNPDRRRRLESSGVGVHEIAADEQGQVPVRSVVENLAGQGFRTVFVEGGAKIITSFLRAGLVHRMIVVIAPVIIGRGVEAVGDLEITSLDQALRPRRSRTRRLGRDRVWELYFDEP
jgi:riboflavin-specific deaminase-like protein